MSTPWGLVTVENVADATGDLTQLFPDYCTPGTGAATMGNEVRQCTDGVLLRLEISPGEDQNGGVLEIWDVAGITANGVAANNINTGNTLTNAYLLGQKALGLAKLVWHKSFKGDSGLSDKIFQIRTPISRGLAARYIFATEGEEGIGAGETEIQLNIVASGIVSKRQYPG